MLGLIKGIKLSALATSVSKNRVSIAERCAHLITPKQAARMARGTGFKNLSITPVDVCTSDLCFKSAKELFDRELVKSEDIGALIFLTQTPDYQIPATSYVLQSRLNLPEDIVIFDINAGCPGFVYGIYVASMLLSGMDRKVLFCCGDTSILAEWLGDTSMLPLFGDGGVAAVIEKSTDNPDCKIFYNINSYGGRWDCLYIPRGGLRANKITDSEGNLITTLRDNYVIMDGMGIMDFSLKETPNNIEQLIEYAGVDKANIDVALFHQANKMIVESLGDKLKLPRERVPFRCEDIGNTSSASIPVCMTELKRRSEFNSFKTALLSGFGVGLSVASVIMDLSNTTVLETLQYE